MSGRFTKGKSGNPGGRPKGAAIMAKLIREQTRDGAELVEYALGVLRDKDATERNRAWAQDWLSDRGFGKPVQAVDLNIGGDLSIETRPPDLSKLSASTLEELETLESEAADSVDDDGDGE